MRRWRGSGQMGGAARQAARTRGASRERQGGLAGAATKNHGVYDRCGELEVSLRGSHTTNETRATHSSPPESQPSGWRPCAG